MTNSNVIMTQLREEINFTMSDMARDLPELFYSANGELNRSAIESYIYESITNDIEMFIKDHKDRRAARDIFDDWGTIWTDNAMNNFAAARAA